MGLNGSGKGTQGKLLAATRGYHIISTGELLRNYGSDEQHERMLQGVNLGDEEVTALLDKALKDLDDQNKTILDGYPRRISQAEWLLGAENSDRFRVDYVINLIASKDALIDRLKQRGRADDHQDAIEARFREYEKETLPIVDYLRQRGVEIIPINAEQPIEDVHQEILAADYEQKQKAA
jgi:adenylate kinase